MPKTKLAAKLKKGGVKIKNESNKPLWKGPEIDGITQSLIGSYLVCKERFRIKTIEGLKPANQFNHRLEYGNMWHLCEENHLKGSPWTVTLKEYCQKLCKKYPLQQQEIEKWYQVCKVQFPIYISYWMKHSSTKKSFSVLQEYEFKVPYQLSSGRVVLLRGKWDGVDLIGKGRNAQLWLKEHKTKGEIKEESIGRQLSFDLQTMFYIVALQERLANETPKTSLLGQDYGRVSGVLYNVIRRPVSGGKGNIRPHKATSKKPAETLSHYYSRLEDIIKEDPDYFFMRWDVAVLQEDIKKFKEQFLNPVLENICNDYEWWSWCKIMNQNPFSSTHFLPKGKRTSNCYMHHYRFPFGVYNALIERGSSELDEYLATGSTVGLERCTNLFPELSE